MARRQFFIGIALTGALLVGCGTPSPEPSPEQSPDSASSVQTPAPSSATPSSADPSGAAPSVDTGNAELQELITAFGEYQKKVRTYRQFTQHEETDAAGNMVNMQITETCVDGTDPNLPKANSVVAKDGYRAQSITIGTDGWVKVNDGEWEYRAVPAPQGDPVAINLAPPAGAPFVSLGDSMLEGEQVRGFEATHENGTKVQYFFAVDSGEIRQYFGRIPGAQTVVQETIRYYEFGASCGITAPV